ncbi:MAG: polyphosphate kinase 2 family protein [Actinomyces sp.]|jgi:PPK2 family polyphosphate:nucleotide phosphotransferase|nr:PPK2 family polyphosphate kinase [Actinomyces sp.]MCI1641676.1 polyphosphate kinase 2 family protein [Actinomyces sp.]MCI1661851.1 polyphosphate kinase 2 family protein [Actinomyces sp.]MCI1690693.1 polyphosphate kinase 2 family protein [Actinomyces sp.]MCI1786705.1 polyphosphate kinase 2 family protein [Actinomyces sp.]MCI1829151.1 polyphosphate kinase 2 family protein [Actinomyces sp.]
MGQKKDRREAEQRRRAIDRAKKAVKKARKDRERRDQAARESASDVEDVTRMWDRDPRGLLAASPEFSLAALARDATPGWQAGRAAGERATVRRCELLSEQQERLFAAARGGATDSVLLILQGLDTAGKGGIVRHVVGQVDPQGVQLAAFKAPTEEERSHDFLWRVRPHLPRPGFIGVFDRSHYEDLLVPTAQALTGHADEHGQTWTVPREELDRRERDIARMEAEAARSGTRVVKVCLMVSYEEQGRRLRERLDRTGKQWKFSDSDLDTRDDWAHYQTAYEEVLRRTSTRVAPWYVVPADRKWYARLAVTEILVRTLAEIDPQWPAATVDVEASRARLDRTMTPEALRAWSREKAAKEDLWIADDEAMAFAVDTLNADSRSDAALS